MTHDWVAIDFKHGRHSRYLLPERMRTGCQLTSNDSDLLALTQEIALLDPHIADLVDRVDSVESGAHYTAATTD